MRVIPTFDPFEHSHFCLGLSLEPTTVEQLALEQSTLPWRCRTRRRPIPSTASPLLPGNAYRTRNSCIDTRAADTRDVK